MSFLRDSWWPVIILGAPAIYSLFSHAFDRAWQDRLIRRWNERRLTKHERYLRRLSEIVAQQQEELHQ